MHDQPWLTPAPMTVQATGVADAGSAAGRVSGMEVGGLFGSLLAGRISDWLIDRSPNDGAVGKRVQVCLHMRNHAHACIYCLPVSVCVVVGG